MHRINRELGTLLASLALLAVAGAAHAQTVRPVIVEYRGTHVRGKFELVNDQLLPVNVIMEPRSFDVTEDGDPVYRALDPSVKLKLSEMSFRIPAQQSRTIFFDARAESIPAWFTIFATFAGMPKHNGIDIEIELPHTVYMLPKTPLGAADVRVESAVWDSVAKNVAVRVRNVSPRLGRVEQAEVSAKKEKRDVGSFPLLPGASRRVLIPWDAPVAPTTYRLRFQRFTVEDSLRAG
jgi:P pilus assembly chaperone PapD